MEGNEPWTELLSVTVTVILGDSLLKRFLMHVNFDGLAIRNFIAFEQFARITSNCNSQFLVRQRNAI